MNWSLYSVNMGPAPFHIYDMEENLHSLLSNPGRDSDPFSAIALLKNNSKKESIQRSEDHFYNNYRSYKIIGLRN